MEAKGESPRWAGNNHSLYMNRGILGRISQQVKPWNRAQEKGGLANYFGTV